MNRVEIERDGTVAILRLNRPEVLNAVGQAMWTVLLDALAAMYSESAIDEAQHAFAGRRKS